MEPRVNRIPATYGAALAMLDGRKDVRVPGLRQTRVIARQNGIGVNYRGTDVVTLTPEGRTVVVNSAGYRERTTKSRINAVLRSYGCTVHQIGGRWYFDFGSMKVPFVDGPVYVSEKRQPTGTLHQVAGHVYLDMGELKLPEGLRLGLA